MKNIFLFISYACDICIKSNLIYYKTTIASINELYIYIYSPAGTKPGLSDLKCSSSQHSLYCCVCGSPPASYRLFVPGDECLTSLQWGINHYCFNFSLPIPHCMLHAAFTDFTESYTTKKHFPALKRQCKSKTECDKVWLTAYIPQSERQWACRFHHYNGKGKVKLKISKSIWQSYIYIYIYIYALYKLGWWF